MVDLVIEGGAPLAGEIVAPPDKSISHRALMLAALGSGTCEVRPLSEGEDNRSTRRILEALGVSVKVEGDSAFLEGVETPAAFARIETPLDCGNSGTTMRLLSGILAAAGHPYTLTGDPSLCGRPMSRLLPLEAMGARISGRREGGKIYPPITIAGGSLVGCRHDLPVASAQVKSALLFAGLFASGATTVLEPKRSRDHTERMLRRLGVPVEVGEDGALTVRPRSTPWRADLIEVAPDVSSAAFFVAAAVLTKSPSLAVRTAVNPTRTGFFDALRKMGLELDEEMCGDVGGEPVARVRVTGGTLRGAVIEGETALRAIDELPLLAGLAAFAEGRTEIRDAAELRVKESDRIAAAHRMLSAFGIRSTETPDGLIIEGGRPEPGRVDSAGDHRMAMTAAVMALATRGTSTIEGAEVANVSFPGFSERLSDLGARVRSRGG